MLGGGLGFNYGNIMNMMTGDTSRVKISRGRDNTYSVARPASLEAAVSDADFRRAMTHINEVAKRFDLTSYVRSAKNTRIVLGYVLPICGFAMGLGPAAIALSMPIKMILVVVVGLNAIGLIVGFIVYCNTVQGVASKVEHEASILDGACRQQSSTLRTVSFHAVAEEIFHAKECCPDQGGVQSGGFQSGVRKGYMWKTEISIVVKILDENARAKAQAQAQNSIMSQFGMGTQMSQFGMGAQMSQFGMGAPMSQFGMGRQEVAVVATPVNAAPVPVGEAVGDGGGGFVAQLAQLDQLHKSGALSAAEYQAAKGRLLSSNV